MILETKEQKNEDSVEENSYAEDRSSEAAAVAEGKGRGRLVFLRRRLEEPWKLMILDKKLSAGAIETGNKLRRLFWR